MYVSMYVRIYGGIDGWMDGHTDLFMYHYRTCLSGLTSACTNILHASTMDSNIFLFYFFDFIVNYTALPGLEPTAPIRIQFTDQNDVHSTTERLF